MTTEENLTPALPRGVRLNPATIFWVQLALAVLWFTGPPLVSSVKEMAAGFDFRAWMRETNRAGLAYVMVSAWVLSLTLGFYVGRQLDYVGGFAARAFSELEASTVQSILDEARTLQLNIARFVLRVVFSVWLFFSFASETKGMDEAIFLISVLLGILIFYGRYSFVFTVDEVFECAVWNAHAERDKKSIEAWGGGAGGERHEARQAPRTVFLERFDTPQARALYDKWALKMSKAQADAFEAEHQ